MHAVNKKKRSNREETAWLSRRVPNPHNCPVAIPSCGRGKIRWIQTTSNLENVQPLPEAENPAEIWPLLHRTYVRDVPAPLAPQLPIATDIKERMQLQKVIAHSAVLENKNFFENIRSSHTVLVEVCIHRRRLERGGPLPLT